MDRLVMITQVIDEDDPVFGATLDWVESFSRLADEFHVIALKVGSHDLPGNVHVHSLGKERGRSRPVLLFNLYRHVFRLIGNSNGLFIHQGQIYALLVAPLFRLLGRPVLMWKTHGHVPWTMHLGLWFLNRVLTASEDSFSVDTPKRVVTGHGIRISNFTPTEKAKTPFSGESIQLLSVGRICATKQIERMIDLVDLAHERERLHLVLTMVGEPATTDDQRYQKSLRERTAKGPLADLVHWKGSIPHEDISTEVQQCDLFLNFSRTRSVDKAVLEAMALKRPVLTTNPAFRGIKPLENVPYYCEDLEPDVLLERINRWSRLSKQEMKTYQTHARQWVQEHHSLEHLTKRIGEIYAGLLREKYP